MVKREFGPQLAAFERRAEVVANVNAAIEVATMQFRNSGGLAPGDI